METIFLLIRLSHIMIREVILPVSHLWVSPSSRGYTRRSAYLETITVSFVVVWTSGIAGIFSPCLGWLVLSQLLRAEVGVWQRSETFSLFGENGPGNR